MARKAAKHVHIFLGVKGQAHYNSKFKQTWPLHGCFVALVDPLSLAIIMAQLVQMLLLDLSNVGRLT